MRNNLHSNINMISNAEELETALWLKKKSLFYMFKAIVLFTYLWACTMVSNFQIPDCVEPNHLAAADIPVCWTHTIKTWSICFTMVWDGQWLLGIPECVWRQRSRMPGNLLYPCILICLPRSHCTGFCLIKVARPLSELALRFSTEIRECWQWLSPTPSLKSSRAGLQWHIIL